MINTAAVKKLITKKSDIRFMTEPKDIQKYMIIDGVIGIALTMSVVEDCHKKLIDKFGTENYLTDTITNPENFYKPNEVNSEIQSTNIFSQIGNEMFEIFYGLEDKEIILLDEKLSSCFEFNDIYSKGGANIVYFKDEDFVEGFVLPVKQDVKNDMINKIKMIFEV